MKGGGWIKSLGGRLAERRQPTLHILKGFDRGGRKTAKGLVAVKLSHEREETVAWMGNCNKQTHGRQ